MKVEPLEARTFLDADLSSIAVQAAAAPTVLKEWQHSGHTYKLLPASSRTAANAVAGQLGGYLVTINDAAENAWVLGTVGSYLQTVAPTGRLWLGLNDIAAEDGTDGIRGDDFVWSNGSLSTYRNFNGGQPDNFGGDEDVVAMITTGTDAGKWGDYPDKPEFANRAILGVVEIGAETPPAATGSVAGTVFNDLDVDGAKDAGEAGIGGWRVYLDADKDGVFDSTEPNVTTDASGNYKLAGLPAGTYRVRTVPAGGYRAVKPSSGFVDVTLAAGQNATGKRFAYTQKVVISGTSFEDLDGDSLRDSGEPGIAGRRIYLDADNDGVFDGGEKSVLTDAAGKYKFDRLAAGTYRVREVLPSGWRRTPPGSAGVYKLTLGNGAAASGKDFASTRSVLVAGAVFDDADGDGRLDAGEAGIKGVKVFLDADNDGRLDTSEKSVTTDSSGKYRFAALPAGTYRIRVVPPSGWAATAPAAGGSISVTLAAGKTATGKNFGFRATAGILDVYVDANRNGTFDASELVTGDSVDLGDLEQGGARVAIRLVNSGGAPLLLDGDFLLETRQGAERPSLSLGLRPGAPQNVSLAVERVPRTLEDGTVVEDALVRFLTPGDPASPKVLQPGESLELEIGGDVIGAAAGSGSATRRGKRLRFAGRVVAAR